MQTVQFPRLSLMALVFGAILVGHLWADGLTARRMKMPKILGQAPQKYGKKKVLRSTHNEQAITSRIGFPTSISGSFRRGSPPALYPGFGLYLGRPR